MMAEKTFTGIRIEEHAGLVFGSKASSKDDSRYYTRYMHIEEVAGDLVAVCTDGKRMHIVSVKDYLVCSHYIPGEYEISKVLKNKVELVYNPEPDMQFPNWKHVASIDADWQKIASIDMCPGWYNQGAATVIRALDESACIDLAYLTPLAGHLWDVYQITLKGSIKFVCEEYGLTAIIASAKME